MLRIACCTTLSLLIAASGMSATTADRRVADAMEKGDLPAVTRLVAARAAVNTPQPDGTTALHWAVRIDQADAVTLLVKAGADVNAANRYGVTPLSLAATNGNLAIAGKLLAAGARSNDATPDGETALMTAARTGSAPLVKLLLANGAAINAQEKWRGQTALMWAAAEKHAPVVQALIEAGADHRARSTAGLTALIFAARSGDRETVRALLAGGANIDEAASDAIAPTRARPGAPVAAATAPTAPAAPALGSTPLATAITNGHYELAAWMLDQGADFDLDGPRGTALLALIRSRNCERTAVPCHPPTGAMDSLALATLLLDRGANVDARLAQNPVKEGGYDYNYMNLTGATPLLLAVKASDIPMMQLLLNYGADPSIGTSNKTTPLLVAAGIGYIEGQILAGEKDAFAAVKVLVEGFRVDVNTTNEVGETALHGAAYRGANQIARYLVDHGARLDLKDKQGRMPVNIADGAVAGPYFRAHDETAAMLREIMGPAAPPRPTSQGAR